jgi:putative transposase
VEKWGESILTSSRKIRQIKSREKGQLDNLNERIIAMKKTKFTESQIVFALRQADTGVAVSEVCRKMGISEATFYNWKKKFGGLGVSELRRLRQLEEENQ